MEPRAVGGNGCVVCRGRSVAKYRCPACRERYCSVPCCKTHKGLDEAFQMLDSNSQHSVTQQAVLISLANEDAQASSKQCRSKADQSLQPANSDASQEIWREKRLNAEGSPWSVDDILTEEDDENDKVALQRLQLLGKSEELKGFLYNPHLQQLLVQVDQAEDKNALLKNCMQEPLFVEFADCCLQIVEPPEKENRLPD